MLTMITHCLANSRDFCVHHNWISDIKKYFYLQERTSWHTN